MVHLPILRWGVPYKSVDIATVPDFRTRAPYAALSQANIGLIRRDLRTQAEARARLTAMPVAELVRLAGQAAEHFLHATLPLDPLSGTTQTPQDYVAQVSATTGMPWANVRRNMAKVHGVLSQVEEVIAGLTRGLDLSVMDSGVSQSDGRMLSFFPRTDALGVVLPSNSPGVHSLWAPATVLKMPLVLKPGSAEPWTPYRMIQAWIQAGLPHDVFCYYPTDHAGGHEILRQCGRGMVFGDVASTKRWQSDPRVEVHGPGYSKVIIGPDMADDWEAHLDLIVESISSNGGRSCVNASSVWVTRHGDRIAEALSERIARVMPRAADDPDAVLAPFADPAVPTRVSAMIDAELAAIGPDGPTGRPARDVTAAYRGASRIAEHAGGTYLLPTIVRCDRGHSLANREFLFPYASVVEVDAADLPACLGPTLVATVITADRAFADRFVASPHVDRLNLGAISTTKIGWDQPHEGNLFEHLYARRAIQRLA